MARKAPQLAKLTRPRLYKPVARERLFRLLDEKREHPVIWIVGPPGAGKTTLAASYLEEAGVSAVWYQIDAGDSDPATFFYYLKKAIEQASHRRARPLPLLTSEYLFDLAAFTRQFLREAFASLPEEVVLVFDNYHELSDGSTLHMGIKTALAEVPQTANVFFISRTDPPDVFAEPIVNKRIAVVTWDDLRLTQEETRLFAARIGISGSVELLSLHTRSGGWMAGLTLMLENRQGSEAPEQRELKTLDTIFEYFAGLTFQGASPEIQEVLMKTALLPWINATLAEAVTGVPNAIRHIEVLHRRHLFTDRRAGLSPTYQYHALFRAFLKTKAIGSLPEGARQAFLGLAAAEFASGGHLEEAFAMLVDAGDWPGAEKVAIESAPLLIEHGRWQTLSQWIAQLPASRVNSNPWIGYWLGRSATYIEPVSSRPILENAYRIFLERDDKAGQLLCATTVLEGIYFSFESLKPMDPWIDRVVALLQQGVKLPSKQDDLRVHSAVMMGATFRAPVHSMLPLCLRRVFELLNEPFEPNIKVAAASMLHAYSNVAMDLEAQRMASTIARPLLSSPELSPKRALFYLAAEGYSHYVRGRYAESFECYDAADKIVHDYAIQDVNVVSATFGRALCERRAGFLDLAEATTRRAESLPFPRTEHHKCRLLLLKAVVAFDRGRIQSALEHGIRAYKTYDDAGFFNGLVTVGTVIANMAISGGRFDIAEDILLRLRGEDYGAIAENYVGAIVLNQAWLEHRRGNALPRDGFLREALERARQEGARARFHWYLNALSELLPIALSRGIETELVAELAQELSILPSPPDVEEWLWPVKVHTLGRFQLSLDGRPPEYSRKMPRKVLALLKAMVAYGGVEVPEQRLMQALWPDEEGDAARRALTATLHRLRKLLGNARAILQAGGALSLNEQYCWIDAMAFEQRLEAAVLDADGLERAISLYRGPFLAQEDDAPWAVPMRERLRARFIQTIRKHAADMEAASRQEQAVALYLRGIEADHLVEVFYQGLMRCYDRLDRRTEALSTYRRLREILSVTLGVPPSSTTRRLFETLQSS